MLFLALLAAASLLGGLPGAVLSNAPRRKLPPAALLLAAVSASLFLAALCLLARTASLTAAIDRFFPDRPAKLLGCAALFALCCGLGLLVGLLRARGLGCYFRRVSGSRPHRAAVLAAFGGLLFLAAAWALLAWTPSPAPIRLNEICCANFSLCSDESGRCGDYVELINTGDAPVSLEGYFISDNPKKRDRFRLPARTLEPGGLLLLWADDAGKSGTDPGGSIHLNFSLKPGETVYLSSPRGALLDEVPVPARYKNVSLSRLEDQWVLTQGTPTLDNHLGRLFTPPTLEPPTLSLAPGFYAEPQSLSLTAAPGCEIRCTLDGSVPTPESPLYTAPLDLTDVSDQPNRVVSQPNTTPDRSGAITEPVDKATVLRAAAFDAAGCRSETVTAVYFIGERFAEYEKRPVLSIVADPVDLFGWYGICVTGLEYDRWYESGGEGEAPWLNYLRKGRPMERDAVITLWDETRSPVLHEACGIRLQGNSTRNRPVKRFCLLARTIYGGSECFSVPLFGQPATHSFFTRPDADDVMAQKLAEGLDLGGLDAIPAAVFLNGEFYCETYLRERYDPQYFENHFGADPEDLILITDGTLSEGTEADYEDYLAFLDFVSTHDCADPQVWAEIQARMDVKNYANFVALNLYCGNTDWSDTKNYKLWHSRRARNDGPLDGRWRWLVYDMDGCEWCASRYGAHRGEFDSFQAIPPHTEASYLELPLFSDLLKNPEFKALFAASWLELSNAVLRPEKAEALAAAFDMPESSREYWSYLLEVRPSHAMEILIRNLELDAAPCAMTLKTSAPAAGALLLDGLPLTDPRRDGTLPSASPQADLPSTDPRRDGTLPSGLPQANNRPTGDPPAPWTGAWVTGVPLTLTARPAEGWRFVRWTGSVESTDQTLTLTPTADLTLTAVFEPIAP